jgi:hypothetical protein
MREATEAEFNSVLNSNRWTPRYMNAGRCSDVYYSDCGTEIASKHSVTTRGRVQSTTYMINSDRLPKEAK